MAVIGAAFPHAVGLADAAVHVEHDRRLRPARMHPVDRTGQIGQGGAAVVGAVAVGGTAWARMALFVQAEEGLHIAGGPATHRLAGAARQG